MEKKENETAKRRRNDGYMSKKINKSYDNNAHIGINKKNQLKGEKTSIEQCDGMGLACIFFFYFFKTIFLKTQKNTF